MPTAPPAIHTAPTPAPTVPGAVHAVEGGSPSNVGVIHQFPVVGVSVCQIGGSLVDKYGNPVSNPVLILSSETYVDRPAWSHDGRPVWQVTDSGWKLYFDGLSWWLSYHIAAGSPAGRWVSDVDPAYSPDSAVGWHPISPSTGTPTFQIGAVVLPPSSIHTVPANTPTTPPAIHTP